MIYKVTIKAPAINEEVTTEADSEEQAVERAVYSALQRQLKEGEISTELVLSTPTEGSA
jgi:hypothetical protein